MSVNDRCTRINEDGARCQLGYMHSMGSEKKCVFPVSMVELLRRLKAVEEKLDRALEVNDLWDGS